MKKICKEMSIKSTIEFDNSRESIIPDTWNVYTSNNIFEEIFKKKEKDFTDYKTKKKVIKITSKDSKITIYRFWNGAPVGAKTKDTIYVDKYAKYDLLLNKDQEKANLILSRGSKIAFYLNHYDHMVRVSFKLGLWSVIIGVVSFVFSIISLFK